MIGLKREGERALEVLPVKAATRDLGRAVQIPLDEAARPTASRAAVAGRAAKRAQALGAAGRRLLRWLPVVPENFTAIGLKDQLSYVEGHLRRAGSREAIAVAVLCCDVMVQLPLGDADTDWLVDLVFPQLEEDRSIDLKRERELRPFPLKKATAANTKVNVSFSDAFESLIRLRPGLADRFSAVSGHMRGLYNDQAAMCVLAAASISPYFLLPVDIAIQMAQDPEASKTLTILIKGLGLNSTQKGAVICEGQCLGGKGLARGSLYDEASERVKKAPKQLFADADLRRAIRIVLDNELPEDDLLFQDADEFWSSRWLWCVNGGHSRAVERHDNKWKVAVEGRVHRRVAMENWEANPLREWDGEVFVSASWKEENGKVRLILACDTVSYTCFEHLLRPVEAAWRNDRVLLDPGKSGLGGIAEKVRALGPWSRVSVMMDYDDFNSQHTTRSMEILFEELVSKTGYSKEMGQRLVNSFAKQRIYAEGEFVGTAAGTLMSGHRGTTIINSVLNLAYIIAAAPDMWHARRYYSIHTGDDVVSVFFDFSDVSRLLTKLEAASVRLNPLKQSVGMYTREFLRMAVCPSLSIGYVMRSIASVVSGNWVTEGMVGPEGHLMSVITSARSLINRCGTDLPVRLLVKSVVHRTGYRKKLIEPALLGRLSVNGGPVFNCVGSGRIELAEVRYQHGTMLRERIELAGVGTRATSAYLSHHVSPVERFALEVSGSSVYSSMLEASYAKSLTEKEGAKALANSVLRRSGQVMMLGMDLDIEIRGREPRRGVLSKYPILQLMRRRLSVTALCGLLKYVGKSASVKDAVQIAWGSESRPVMIRGFVPYGEAALLSQKTNCSIITVMNDVRM